MYKYEIPAEVKVTNIYYRDRWFFYSTKCKRIIKCFSNLLHAEIINLEMDSRVEFFCEYPFIEEIKNNDKTMMIYPDLWVKYSNGEELFLIIDNTANSEKEETHNQEIVKYLNQKAMSYKVLTYKDICKGRFTTRNLSWLAARTRRGDSFYMSPEVKQITEYIKSSGKISIESLLQYDILNEWEIFDVISHLFYKGAISIDGIDSRVINKKMEVSYIGV